MAINRRFLYAGLFLVALGGVLVAVDLAAIETTALTNVLRLWPVALMAIGVGIVLRRSRYALVAGIVGAMLPGLVLGGGLAIAPRHGLDCGAGDQSGRTSTQRGTLPGPAAIQVDSSCGSIAIGTQSGADWQLVSSGDAGREPDVSLTGDSLQVASVGGEDWSWLESGRDTWSLMLPTTPMELLRVNVDAGRASLALPGANFGTVVLTGSGAEIVADLTGARVVELDGTLDFGRMAIQLPQGTYSGRFRIGAGELRLCTPFGLAVHVDFAGTPREVRVNGLRTDATEWQTDNYLLSGARVDLTVKVNFGNVLINPIGGCK
jgi:hypothetical protein